MRCACGAHLDVGLWERRTPCRFVGNLTQTHIDTRIHTHTYTHTQTHIYARIHTYRHKQTHIHTYTNAYTHMYTHTHTRCTQTNTHTHTNTQIVTKTRMQGLQRDKHTHTDTQTDSEGSTAAAGWSRQREDAAAQCDSPCSAASTVSSKSMLLCDGHDSSVSSAATPAGASAATPEVRPARRQLWRQAQRPAIPGGSEAQPPLRQGGAGGQGQLAACSAELSRRRDLQK